MNSRTDDYTGLKSSSFEDNIRQRYVSSSLKKKPYFPRKTFNLAPLNLKEIKKELEEAAESGDIENKCSSTRETTETTVKDILHNSNSQDTLNDGSEEVCKNVVDDSRSTTSSTLDIISRKKNEGVSLIKTQNNCVGSSCSQVVSTKFHNDDSFDLDFSALSLKTPVKSVEQLLTTPRFGQDDQVTRKLETPNMSKLISTKLQFTLPKNHFVTPKNPMNTSSVKTVTPSLSTRKKAPDSVTKNIICSIPKTLPIDESFTKMMVNNTAYFVLNLLGKGGSSEVYQCYCLKSKLLVAIKCVSLHDEASSVGYINEVRLLQQLQNCDRIIKLYDFEIVRSQKKLYMVLDRGGDDLSTILKKLSLQSTHLPLYTILFYWMNMLHAVKQIHSHGIIHSDLKPANFINSDDGLKLIDFGIASAVMNDETSVVKTKSEGSCNYISPEALNSESSSSPNSKFSEGKYKVHFKSDVWSLGCILYELVYGKTPFHQFNKLYSKLSQILNPNHKIQYPEVSWVPPKLLNTIRCCLTYDVKARPSVDQLIGEYEIV